MALTRPVVSPSPFPNRPNPTQPNNRAREEAIAIEMVKNLREKVAWCQRAHPVTHYYDCADIVQKYLKLVKVRLGGSVVWINVG
jgi:hypothetical protein